MPPKDGSFHYFTEAELQEFLTDFGAYIQRSVGIAIAQSFGSVEPFASQAIQSLLSTNLVSQYPDIADVIVAAVTTLAMTMRRDGQ